MPLKLGSRMNMVITGAQTYNYAPPSGTGTTNATRFSGMGLGVGHSMIGRISNLKPGCGSCGK